MKEIIENEKGEIGVIQHGENCQIHRTNLWHGFTIKQAVEMGLEKACILGNIDGFRLNDLEKVFPYIEPERLKTLINELVLDGFLKMQD
jgi:hypothetical protein